MKFEACNKAVSSYSGLEMFIITKDIFEAINLPFNGF